MLAPLRIHHEAVTSSNLSTTESEKKESELREQSRAEP
jgi:hypothetical protein